MIRINLLKPESKEARDAQPSAPVEVQPRAKLGNLGALILVLAVAGLGAYYFIQKKNMDQEREFLARAQQEKEKLQYVTQKLDEVQKQKANLERKITLITWLKAQQDRPVRLMDALSRNIPDWVWLTEATYGPQGVQVKGKALSNNLIADYMSSLESSPVLTNVYLVSSTQAASGKEQVLDFTLLAALEIPPNMPPPPKAPEEAADAAKPKTPVAKKPTGAKVRG
jgi:Tfp pilus assembly protein PilN